MGSSQSTETESDVVGKLQRLGYNAALGADNVWEVELNVASWLTFVRQVDHRLVLIKSVQFIEKTVHTNLSAYLCNVNVLLADGVFGIDYEGDSDMVYLQSTVGISNGIRFPANMLVRAISRHAASLQEFAEKIANVLKTPPSTDAYHFGKVCNKCNVSPIRGGRYWCKQCAFSLCANCKNEFTHHHTLVVFATPFSDPVSPTGEEDRNTLAPVEALTNLSIQSSVTKIAETELTFAMVNGKKVKIGKGGFATVYKAEWHGTTVAVKYTNQELPPDVRESFKREVNTLATLRHPRITPMLAICEDPPFIVMPFMNKGSLQKIINTAAEVPLAIKLKYLIDTAQGMAFVHGNKILHGDLKPDNVLVDDNNIAYIADFGISKIKTQTIMTTGRARDVATIFTSPEFMANGQLSIYSDVFSFGVLAWALLTFKTPYLNEYASFRDLEVKLSTGLRPNTSFYPPTTPQPLKDLITECWNADPLQRPPFVTISQRLQTIAGAVPL